MSDEDLQSLVANSEPLSDKGYTSDSEIYQSQQINNTPNLINNTNTNPLISSALSDQALNNVRF